MFISSKALNKANKENVLRLARFLEIETHLKPYDHLLLEIHYKVNWLKVY